VVFWSFSVGVGCLRGRLRSLREERRSLEEGWGTVFRSLPPDPVAFCREWLCYEPFGYMQPFLRNPSHFVAVVAARQTGKTFNGMAKLLYIALRYPGSTILVTAPKFDQVKRIAFKHLHSHLHSMKALSPRLFRAVVGSKGVMRTIVRLRNG